MTEDRADLSAGDHHRECPECGSDRVDTSGDSWLCRDCGVGEYTGTKRTRGVFDSA